MGYNPCGHNESDTTEQLRRMHRDVSNMEEASQRWQLSKLCPIIQKPQRFGFMLKTQHKISTKKESISLDRVLGTDIGD